ncbi:Gfo/Idh/MocA family oxidoreductase [Planosporangium thailandense]|uniref:Gfo/Idh/MocA family oxidoreductase n=2 Tax=Planosporangium thailandense TaxID=765197 RepID=A0ABX0Y5X2_9ACTN|nr:Gfo/Idh/MocA family oxidoreductase [Planosporangium thailandense]
MAKAHARVVQEDPRTHLAGWVSRQSSPTGIDEFGPVPVHRTVDDLLRDESVAIVIVATPDFAHRNPSVAAARAGRHVLIEKPLAMSGADAEAILAAVRGSGVHAMTLFNQRWAPAYWQAKQELAQPSAGRPIMAYARKNDTLHVPTKMIPWADRSSPSWFLSSHDVDLVTWFFDAPAVEVYATAVERVLVGMGIDTPDAVHAQVRFADGAVATFESSWSVPEGYPTVVESFVEVLTSDRHIHVDRKVEQLEIATAERMYYPRTGGTRIGGRNVGPAASAVRHFIDVVVDGVEPIIPLEHSVRVTWLLEAIEKSYRSGAPVRVNAAGGAG